MKKEISSMKIGDSISLVGNGPTIKISKKWGNFQNCSVEEIVGITTFDNRSLYQGYPILASTDQESMFYVESLDAARAALGSGYREMPVEVIALPIGSVLVFRGQMITGIPPEAMSKSSAIIFIHGDHIDQTPLLPFFNGIFKRFKEWAFAEGFNFEIAIQGHAKPAYTSRDFLSGSESEAISTQLLPRVELLTSGHQYKLQ